MNFRKLIWGIDKVIIISVMFLEFIGTLTILRLSYIMSNRFKTSYDLIFFLKHTMFIFASIIIMFIFSSLKWEKSKKTCNILFFIFLFLNFLTVLIGHKSNGVRRWISFPGFSLQSSEFVKVLVVFPVSKLLSISDHKKTMLLISVSIFSCLIQPDLGMTFLIASSSSSLIFLKGENLKHYLKILLLTLTGLLISGAFLAKYAFNRIMIFFGKKEGFQISQSLKIFASSKLIGAESNNIYIPDSHCDFMFAEIVAGFGILVGFVIIIIPIFLLFYINEKNKNYKEEERLISIGIINQLAIQTYFHVLSNMAFVPTKGLNLPFVSFGGSSLLAHSIGIGILLGLTKRSLFL